MNPVPVLCGHAVRNDDPQPDHRRQETRYFLGARRAPMAIDDAARR